jgi:hypothetical protein
MSDNTTEENKRIDYKVLENPGADREILGTSKLELVGAIVPGAVIWTMGQQFAPPGTRIPVYLSALGAAGVGLAFVLAKRPEQTAREYVEEVVRNATHQEVMLFDNNPEDSGIAQPENTSRFARLGRLPGVSSLPYVGGAGDIDAKAEDEGRMVRAQDIVQYERAFEGTPAIMTDEGTIVGAAKISPANMATRPEKAWERQAEVLANVLNTAASGSIQIADYMRDADYSDRITQWSERHDELVTAGNTSRDEGKVVYDELPFGQKVLADLCEEQIEVAKTYDLTTLETESFVIVEVEPEDIVTRDDIEGGLASLKWVGDLYKKYKIDQLKEDGEHIPEMISLLEDRLDTFVEGINLLDGVSAHTVPSERLAQAAANHYQATNVYSHPNYTSLVRQSPIPTPDVGGVEDATDTVASKTDPEYDLTFSHLDVEAERNSKDTLTGTHARKAIAEKHVGRDAPSAGVEQMGEAEPAAATDGGSVQETDAEWGDGFPASNPGVADIAITDDELDEQFRNLLAPERVDRSSKSHLEIGGEGADKVYSSTLFVSQWPRNPPNWILDDVLRFDDPDVGVNRSTHINVIDQDRAEKDLENLKQSSSDKVEDIEESPIPGFEERAREDERKAHEMVQSFLNSDYDMFESQTYLEVQSRDPDALQPAIRRLSSKLSDMGAGVSSTPNNHDRGHQTMAPACQDKLGQKVKMRADGIAAANSWTKSNHYEPSGVEIGENTAVNQPCSVDIFNRSAGFNWMIVGKTGAGKTITASKFLWRQKARSIQQDDEEMFIAVIDPLQEFANLQEIFGGERIVVGSTNLNPFDITPTPKEKLGVIGEDAPYREWMDSNMDFVELYYRMQGFDFSDYRAVWNQAIKIAGRRKGVTSDPKTHAEGYRIREGYGGNPPTVRDAIEVINEMSTNASKFVTDPDNENQINDREDRATTIINNHVEPFKEGGHLEHLAQQTEVDLSGTDFVWADLQLKEGDEQGGGLMMHLLLDLFYNEAKVRDGKSMIFADEFHYLLKDDMTVQSLSQKYRHHRHWDLSIGAGTQSHKDFFGEDDSLTDNAETMMELSSMEIYQFVEGMNDKWADKLGLTSTEGEIIDNLQKGDKAKGYSEALVRIDDVGCLPLKIWMDPEMNPREAAALMYDPTDHGEDYEQYLREHDSEWRWE